MAGFSKTNMLRSCSLQTRFKITARGNWTSETVSMIDKTLAIKFFAKHLAFTFWLLQLTVLSLPKEIVTTSGQNNKILQKPDSLLERHDLLHILPKLLLFLTNLIDTTISDMLSRRRLGQISRKAVDLLNQSCTYV